MGERDLSPICSYGRGYMLFLDFSISNLSEGRLRSELCDDNVKVRWRRVEVCGIYQIGKDD